MSLDDFIQEDKRNGINLILEYKTKMLRIYSTEYDNQFITISPERVLYVLYSRLEG